MKEELCLWPDRQTLIVVIANFLFVLEAAPHLDRQYTVFGKVINGMEFVDKIKKGDGPNGMVSNPDKIISISIKK